MKKLAILIILLIAKNTQAQNVANLAGMEIAKIVDGNLELISDKNLLINAIEQKLQLPNNTITDLNVGQFVDGIFVQIFTYDNYRLSILMKSEGDIVTICGQVACTTVACYKSATHCQPQYGNTCTSCDAGDCTTEVLIVKPKRIDIPE